MSAVESALDVLSRAATMVQGQFTPFGISFRGSGPFSIIRGITV